MKSRLPFSSVVSRFVLALTIHVVVAGPVAGFQLDPMSAVIRLDQSNATTTFDVRNTTGEPIAVQMRVATRSIQPDGTELNEDASDVLQLFPSQIILRAGQTQTIRVRWLGDSAPEAELPFRVIAEQLPINLSREQNESSGVRMMLRYRATLYVQPANVAANAVVSSLEADGSYLRMTIENRGTAHAPLAEAVLVMRFAGEERTLPAGDIPALSTVNVLPGELRQLRIPIADLPGVPDEISFRLGR